MSPIELVVFDWDGTLMDSASRIVGGVRAAIDAIGAPPRSDDQIRSRIGLGVNEAVASLYPEMARHERQQLAQAYLTELARSAAATPSPLFPGVVPTLTTLANEGRRLGIATGKSRAGLVRDLASVEIAHHFDATRTVDEAPSKPHAGMLEAVMAECDVPAAATVLVGDTLFDLEMAERAGVRAIAVPWGVHSVEQLRAAQPVAMLERIHDLPACLNTLQAAAH